MPQHIRNGTISNDPRLDRIYRPDPNNYPLRKTLEEKAVEPRSYTWACRVLLDQGQEGACVGFGFAGELASIPNIWKVTNKFAREQLYWNIQRNDQWRGGAYPGAQPFYEGTSVLDGARYLQKIGAYGEYRWAATAEEFALAIGNFGPGVMGINWYTGMMRPDRRGYLNITGQVEGGHCTVVRGYNVRLKRFLVQNSWGPDWWHLGQMDAIHDLPPQGCAFIHLEDMERLRSEDGDMMIPVVRLKQPKNMIPLGIGSRWTRRH